MPAQAASRRPGARLLISTAQYYFYPSPFFKAAFDTDSYQTDNPQ